MQMSETGETVYQRTYSRTKPDGSRETWDETVERVVDGNLALGDSRHELPGEREDLVRMMREFKIIPAGRHLWASGVKGRQYLFNCFAAGTEVHLDDGIWDMDQLVRHGTVNVLSEGGAYRPATFHAFGEQEIWDVELVNGEVFRTTAGHEWVLRDGRRTTTDRLNVGARLPYNLPDRPVWNDESETGFAHGVVYGDGTMSKQGNSLAHVLLFGEKRAMATRISDSGSGVVNVHEDYTYVGGFPRMFRELPAPAASSHYWHGFIAGLIATDGTVNDDTVCIDQKNLDDLDTIRRYSRWVGLHPRQIKLTRTTSPFTGDVSPMYRLRFSGWSVQNSDLQRGDQRARFEIRERKQRTVSVKRVENTHVVEPVYCAVEPETHTITIGSGVLTGNCHVSGWNERVTDHFSFTFLRLMEGGGVGANYSNRYLDKYSTVSGHEMHVGGCWSSGYPYRVHIVCDPEHPDHQRMRDAGLLSTEYVSDWDGCYEVADSREGWSDALTDLIETWYRPAKNVNRVFDVSRVRGAGERLKTFGGRASGPLPLALMLHEVAAILNARIGSRLDGIGAMEIDHAIATCVVSGGNRRSARMSIMRWDDEQIRDFLRAKQDTGKHWTTNISVEVDSEFYRLAEYGNNADLDADIDRRTEHACEVLYAISNGMLANGEPGIWNSELSNVGEPNEVTATNPCGEIALEAWENCNLGHVNLAAFAEDVATYGDFDDLFLAHRLMTRFLIRATNGDVNDPKQAATLARNRRIGVGHLGVASYLALSGIKYSEAPNHSLFIYVLGLLADAVDTEAVNYAHDLRIPVPVKTRTVAPTGTIAKMPGVSEGIHPIFAKYFVRRIRFSDVDVDQRATVADYLARGYHVEPCKYAPDTTVVAIPTKDSLLADVEALYGDRAEEIVESAADVSLRDMLAFQAMYQSEWADNAVSYTVNVDPGKYTVEELAGELLRYGSHLKGATVFPEMSREQSPYERLTRDEYEQYATTEVADSLDEACASGACPIR